MSDAHRKDALDKIEADYSGLDRGVLEAYLHAAKRFSDVDGGLAQRRVRAELDKLDAAAREAQARKDAARAALLADTSWKERDTFGLNTRAFRTAGGAIDYAGGNTRYVVEGGYKEYADALAAEKERDGNSGSALKGAVQFTLAEEMTYISGGRGYWNDSDDAIAAIKERYDLPCWGALARKAEITGSKRTMTFNPRTATMEEFEAEARRNFDEVQQRLAAMTDEERAACDKWMMPGMMERYTTFRANSIVPVAAIEVQIEKCVEIDRNDRHQSSDAYATERDRLVAKGHAARAEGIKRAFEAREQGKTRGQSFGIDTTPLTDEQAEELGRDIEAREQAGYGDAAWQPGLNPDQRGQPTPPHIARALAEEQAREEAAQFEVEAPEAPPEDDDPVTDTPPEAHMPANRDYIYGDALRVACLDARKRGDYQQLDALRSEENWRELTQPPRHPVEPDIILAVEARYPDVRLDGMRKYAGMPWVDDSEGLSVGKLVVPGEESDGEAQADDRELLDMIDGAIEFHRTKTRLQRNIDQWNAIREAIVAGEASAALKARVERAAAGARPGAKYYVLWMAVRDKVRGL